MVNENVASPPMAMALTENPEALFWTTQDVTSSAVTTTSKSWSPVRSQPTPVTSMNVNPAGGPSSVTV